MRYCPRCGVPRALTAEHKWGSNGTITLSRDVTHRMVVVDNDALSNIFDSISSRIGLPVTTIVTEAKRKSARHFMDAILSGVKGALVRNLASARAYQELGKQTILLGLGFSEVTGYKRHCYLEGAITEAYNVPAIAGDIAGAFDSVEGLAGEVSFEEEGSVLRLTIRATDAPPIYVDRFTSDWVAPLPGRNIMELCSECRAPIQLGRQYAFDVDRGLIHENKTGHRVVLLGRMTLKNLFGELEAELGDEIPAMIMNIERERARDAIIEKGRALDNSAEGYMRFMKTFQLKGMGNGADVSVEAKRVRARVDNPYYEPLVAGALAGFYEATGGEAAQVQWSEATEGYTEVGIEPA